MIPHEFLALCFPDLRRTCLVFLIGIAINVSITLSSMNTYIILIFPICKNASFYSFLFSILFFNVLKSSCTYLSWLQLNISQIFKCFYSIYYSGTEVTDSFLAMTLFVYTNTIDFYELISYPETSLNYHMCQYDKTLLCVPISWWRLAVLQA